MAKVCQITGKRFQNGNKVSHSNVKSKDRKEVNLQNKTLTNPATGQTMRVRVSTSALRTLKKWDEAGKKYDLRELVD